MKSGGTSFFGEEKQTEDEFVTVSKEYLMDLEKKAKESDYFKGRVAGMEFIIATIKEAYKSK